MARETKEQKELRWAAEAHIVLVAKEAFKKTMPERLMKLQALASEACISTRVLLTVAGPAVEFTRHNYDDRMNDLEETLTYDSEEWEVENLERRLTAIKEDIEARRARRVLAEDVWKNKLSPDEKIAIKEFISNLQ